MINFRNIFLLVSTLLIAMPHQVKAQDYKVEQSQTLLTFSGTHAGNSFVGKFDKWDATLSFNPDSLSTSSLKASFDTASAKTGNPMYDGTLPQTDWFDSKAHPTANFISREITKVSDGVYKAKGDLTIRHVTKPIEFDFTLSDLSQNIVKVKADFKIDRLAYEIGLKSDPKSEWVSQMIDISLGITAVKIQ
jgi:polyisoprenoid-binding protein YceI